MDYRLTCRFMPLLGSSAAGLISSAPVEETEAAGRLGHHLQNSSMETLAAARAVSISASVRYDRSPLGRVL
jgi:hypothetical protein